MILEPSIGTTFDYSIPIEPMLELIHEAGFDYITIGMKLDHSSYHTPDGRANLKKLLSKFQLSIDSIHANYIHEDVDIASVDESKREAGVRDFSEVIHDASDLGSNIVVVHPHRYYEKLDHVEKRVDSVLKSFESLIKTAKRSDVMLAVENLYTEGSDIILRSLFEKFSPDDLGFCYDSSHDFITRNQPFGELLRTYYNRLLTTHFSDNMGKDDDHMIPYTGEIDFDLITEIFPKDVYKGRMQLETETRNHQELKDFPEEFLRLCFDAAMRLRKEVLSFKL